VPCGTSFVAAGLLQALASGVAFPDQPSPGYDRVLERRRAVALAVGPALVDPVAQRELAAATRLSGPERYLTYGALDLALARDVAPLVAFGNISSHDLFSAWREPVGRRQASLHHPHRRMRAAELPETLGLVPSPNEECRYVHRDASDQPVSN
jgi:hypothetical protein